MPEEELLEEELDELLDEELLDEELLEELFEDDVLLDDEPEEGSPLPPPQPTKKEQNNIEKNKLACFIQTPGLKVVFIS